MPSDVYALPVCVWGEGGFGAQSWRDLQCPGLPRPLTVTLG